MCGEPGVYRMYTNAPILFQRMRNWRQNLDEKHSACGYNCPAFNGEPKMPDNQLLHFALATIVHGKIGDSNNNSDMFITVYYQNMQVLRKKKTKKFLLYVLACDYDVIHFFQIVLSTSEQIAL